MKNLRKVILQDAIDLTCNERNDAHGDPFDNHERIALIWTAILDSAVTAQQVALCMAGVKMARASYNPEHMDSYIDGAAYFAIAGEVHDVSRQRRGNIGKLP